MASGMLAMGILSPTARSTAAPPAEGENPAPWQQDLLIAQIYDRLALANAAWCPQTRPIPGLLLHDLGAYDQAARPLVERRYGLGQDLGILAVVPGGAADQAGLRGGDAIVTVGSAPMANLYGKLISAKASPARTTALEQELLARLQDGPQMLTVRRQGAQQGAQITLKLSAPSGCSGNAQVGPGETLDAWSDGRNAVISAGLLRKLAREEEIAFVIAHEMGHNWLDQAAAVPGNRPRDAWLRKIAAMKMDGENKADLIGAMALHRANYPPEAGLALLDRLAMLKSPAESRKLAQRRALLASLLKAEAEP